MDERGSGDGQENKQSAVGQVKATKKSSDFKLDEKLLNELINLGIDKNTAKKTVFYTTNGGELVSNVEKCMDFIFTNPNPTDLGKTTLEEELGLEEISQLCPGLNIDDRSQEDFKMVFVLNTSLNMSLGKSCSQTAHAALAIANEIVKDKYIRGFQNWLVTGQTKIVLAGESTHQLDELAAKAESLGLASQIIQDAGRTEIPSGSKSVCVIFGEISLVDKVTGKLRLLK